MANIIGKCPSDGCGCFGRCSGCFGFQLRFGLFGVWLVRLAKNCMECTVMRGQTYIGSCQTSPYKFQTIDVRFASVPPLFVKTKTQVIMFVDPLAVCLAEAGLVINPGNTKNKGNLQPSCVHPCTPRNCVFCLESFSQIVGMHVISGPNCQSCPRSDVEHGIVVSRWVLCDKHVSLALRFRCSGSICSCDVICNTWMWFAAVASICCGCAC